MVMIGEFSRYDLCVAKLLRDSVVVTVVADARVLVHSKLELVSSFMDRLGVLGNNKDYPVLTRMT